MQSLVSSEPASRRRQLPRGFPFFRPVSIFAALVLGAGLAVRVLPSAAEGRARSRRRCSTSRQTRRRHRRPRSSSSGAAHRRIPALELATARRHPRCRLNRPTRGVLTDHSGLVRLRRPPGGPVCCAGRAPVRARRHFNTRQLQLQTTPNCHSQPAWVRQPVSPRRVELGVSGSSIAPSIQRFYMVPSPGFGEPAKPHLQSGSGG
jgi:hypothetical protein